MAKELPDNDKIIERIENENDSLYQYIVDQIPEAIGVITDDPSSLFDSIENVGDMCMKSKYRRLYCITDRCNLVFYFTANNNEHARIRLGVK